MYAIFRKEVSAFFNSLIAYVVMAAFMVLTGAFLWLFDNNVLESGYASMDLMFDFGPYLVLFLVPAITMRAFSEEMRNGTLELLQTKPLSDWELILGKYAAALFLIFFSLMPTLIYVASLWYLGNPPGNLDKGATLGAYIGLLGVGAIFAAVGLFSSSLSEGQIVAFIVAVLICFVLFVGFDLLAGIRVLGPVNGFLLKTGIMDHYRSISRGVIDSRDLLYYLSASAVFLIATRIVLNRRLA